MATALIVAETVFVPAAVELSVPVTTPLAFVVPTGCVSVFPALGEAASVTVAPGIGFPLASRAVTVIVVEPAPAVIDVGAAAAVDCDADAPVAVTVFVPAAVELNVPVICPVAFVVATG